MSNLWQSVREWARSSKKQPEKELSRSDYSLVSCGEVTADTLQLWLDLPEEVKNDPELAPLKQKYEKEHGAVQKEQKSKNPVKKTLKPVYSAPILGHNEPNYEEVEFTNGNKHKFSAIEEKNDETQESTTEDQGPPIKNQKYEKLSEARYYAKMAVLLGCWVFFTAIFLTYGEKHEVKFLSSVSGGEEKNYSLIQSSTAFAVKLCGPFLSRHAQMKLNSTEYDTAAKIEVWIQRTGLYQTDTSFIEKSKPWTLLVQNMSEFEEVSNKLTLEHFDSRLETPVYIHIRSKAPQSVAFVASYSPSPVDGATGAAYACVLLVTLYTLIIFEIINRTMAAVIVSTMSLATLALVGQRPSIPEIISWLDEETLLLLFSMMILVAIMAETGIFDFLAVFTFEVTKGKLWPLIFLLCGITAVLSTFLDNVTTVLLMSPVTISAYSLEVGGLKLKQVLVLSRHNLRTPLTTTLARMTPKQWPKWDAEVGHLTRKGATLERNMGKYFSAWLKKEALLSNRCPNEDTVFIYANTKQRTKATAFAFSEAAFPDCDIAVNFRNITEMDPIFNPIIHSRNDSFKQVVLQEMIEKLKNSNLRDVYLELNHITDIQNSEICKDNGLCNLANSTNVMFFEGQKPTIMGPFYISSVIVDAFLMSYYEGFSSKDIGWGKIKNDCQWKLLAKVVRENQNVRFNVTTAAKDISKPLLKFMKEVIESQIEFAFLVGHNSNQMSVLSSMGFKPFELPEQLELTPIGGKLVFQKWTDGANDFLKVEFVYQSRQQLRYAEKLSLSNPPKKITMYLDKCITNEYGYCPWNEFEKILKDLTD